MSLKGIKIGFAMTGSFCTFGKAFAAAEQLTKRGAVLTPVMSYNAASTDTRFGKAPDNLNRIEDICGRKAILTLADAEPIGPKGYFDLYIICPCTATTLGRLANAIYDDPVSLGAKSHLRGQKPVLLALSTNDGLSMSAKNIGALLGTKGFRFVPFGQDDANKKPASLSADFSLVADAAEAALDGRQLQPVII